MRNEEKDGYSVEGEGGEDEEGMNGVRDGRGGRGDEWEDEGGGQRKKEVWTI